MNRRVLLPLLLSMVSMSSYAEQRWFEVELLVFERNVDVRDIKEKLSSETIQLDEISQVEFLNKFSDQPCQALTPCLHKENPVVIRRDVFNGSGNNLTYLDSSHLQLTTQRERLERHASFNPVLHMAWRMPVAGRNSAKPLHLFAGKNLALNLQQRQIKEQAMLLDLAAQDPASTDEQPLDKKETPMLTDKWAIEGNFKIYLEHYLFIDSQLIIRKEVTQAVQQAIPLELIETENDVQIAVTNDALLTETVQQETVIKEILFDQNRRLRSEEVHYFDHPLMGIIVQIRKIP